PYVALAADVSCVSGRKEAAELLLRAEQVLRRERAAEGLRTAEQSLAAFRQAGDSRGLADAARLVAYAMCLQERRKEADRLLRDELLVCQAAGETAAE
ncbi:unnamed protein product, partial [Polarella glacialis]